MAKIKRVFELAKELGVSSKAIVDKCQAEGVPGITNHMSTVKIGLAETIRQWFGEAQASTAVETAEKVDLTKARRARRRRSAAQKEDQTTEQAATATVQVDEAPPTPASPESGEPSTQQAEQEPAPAESTPAEPAVAAAAPPAKKDEKQDEKKAESPQPIQAQARKVEKPQPPAPPQPVGRPNVPTRPTIVKPAGEQLHKPKQAQLKGPKVVRIEEPEPLPPPRSRRSEPATPVEDTSTGGITRSRGPVRGRGAGGGAISDGEGPADRGKRRVRNIRRGRSADALPVGPTKFSQADMEELDARLRGATGFLKQRRRDLRKREQAGQLAPRPSVTGGKVEVAEPITIKSLSAATGIKTADIIKYLFKKGVMATINSAIDTEMAMEVAMEYDIELDVKGQQTALEKLQEGFESREPVDLRPRPPVVTVLGHVDHGKTSLLDRIRASDVAAHEAGGITQHIGAYRITVKGADEQDKTVVFLDTPGHEAFTAMRARGAKMTDLVVLVVAADDGVMPQTVESINHAKAAGVPIVVALNKIDKPEATAENIRRIYGQLAEHGLNPVEWGGETEVVRTSAATGEGVSDLVEVLDYQATLLELKADYGGPARGTVIESQMQTGRGAVARLLVQQGQLKVGDFIVIGRAYGRVRDITDDRGRPITQAGPATPVEISGIDQIPDAGDKFYVTDTLQKAEEVAKQYRERERLQQLASKTKVTLDNFAAQLKAGQTRDLRVVLKADVQGSIDVLRKSLEELGSDEVTVRVLHAAVGGITESDVLLADASDAVIIGFHVGVTPAVREIAEARDVDIRLYRVIYDVTDDVKKALEGMLEPEKREEELGVAEVREVFKITKVGTVAGCLVTDGAIQRAAKVRVLRDGVVVTENREIASLRRVKEDVREVRAGTECGIRIAGFDDIKTGDLISCYNVVEVKRTLT
ncbi:MAG TPA: translation initiation factor IF-2 [Phycisphaeraceae bacterium]